MVLCKKYVKQKRGEAYYSKKFNQLNQSRIFTIEMTEANTICRLDCYTTAHCCFHLIQSI